MLHGPPSGMQA